MAVHVFASHELDTYLVAADSPVEAKGRMFDRDTSAEYLGTAEEVLGGEQVVKVSV